MVLQVPAVFEYIMPYLKI